MAEEYVVYVPKPPFAHTLTNGSGIRWRGGIKCPRAQCTCMHQVVRTSPLEVHLATKSKHDIRARVAEGGGGER